MPLLGFFVDSRYIGIKGFCKEIADGSGERFMRSGKLQTLEIFILKLQLGDQDFFVFEFLFCQEQLGMLLHFFFGIDLHLPKGCFYLNAD